MNLAYKYPVLFWNTSNLIVDSGAQFIIEEDEIDEMVENIKNMAIEGEGIGPEDFDDEEEEVIKAKSRTTDYGKIASAIGKMQSRGIKVLPPSINRSKLTFTPDVDNNSILYGMAGIVRVGSKVVDDIITNRPYTSLQDLTKRIKINKPQVINLIKCGAFDEFGDREQIMEDYICSISDTKKRLNLQNANMLIQKGLIPDELDLERRVFNFNKYLKKLKQEDVIVFDDIAFGFYERNFDLDLLGINENGNYCISTTAWKSIYDKYMDKIRSFIKANHDELLDELNRLLTAEVRKKYAEGTTAKWSMDSVSFYQDEHELEHIDNARYDIVDFFKLPSVPEVDRTFSAKDGKQIIMYKLYRIAGTVIDRDKAKSTVTLLTPRGVVTVKAYGIFPQYDKQISKIGEDGKKKVIEKSMFSRGNKIIVVGMKRDEHTFFAKKYKSTNIQEHHFERITEVDKWGEMVIQHNRASEED